MWVYINKKCKKNNHTNWSSGKWPTPQGLTTTDSDVTSFFTPVIKPVAGLSADTKP